MHVYVCAVVLLSHFPPLARIRAMIATSNPATVKNAVNSHLRLSERLCSSVSCFASCLARSPVRSETLAIRSVTICCSAPTPRVPLASMSATRAASMLKSRRPTTPHTLHYHLCSCFHEPFRCGIVKRSHDRRADEDYRSSQDGNRNNYQPHYRG